MNTMSIFAKFLATESLEQDVVVAVPGAEPEVEPIVAPVADPLDPVDAFAAERAAAASQEADGTPVDGSDDDMTVGKTDSDKDVADGEFGEDPEPKGDDDVEVDADDSEVEFDNLMEEMSAEEMEIDLLGQEMSMLDQSAVAIESFGFNQTTAMVMQATGLLSGTSLDAIAIESVSNSAAGDAESLMALEAIGDKIKEKAGQWSAKILSVAKNASAKVTGALGKVWDKIKSTATALSSAAWDKAKAGAAVVKAHPYKTAAAVVAAIVAVAGVVAFAGGAPSIGAKADVVKAFLGNIVNKIKAIKLPTGTITAKLNDAGTKIMLTVSKGASAAGDAAKAASGAASKGVKAAGRAAYGAAGKATVTALGWSQSAVKALSGQMDRAWNAVKTAWTAFGTRIVGVVSKGASAAANSAPAKAVGKGVVAAAKGIDVVSKTAESSVKSVLDKKGVGPFKSEIAGAFSGGFVRGALIGSLISTVTILVQLTINVVGAGFRLIASTLSSLRSAMGGKTAEA